MSTDQTTSTTPLDLINQEPSTQDPTTYNPIATIAADFVYKLESSMKAVKEKNPDLNTVQVYTEVLKYFFNSQVPLENSAINFGDPDKMDFKWQNGCDDSTILKWWTKKYGSVKANRKFTNYKIKMAKVKALETFKTNYGEKEGCRLWKEQNKSTV